MHIDVESIVVNLNCLDEPSSLTWDLGFCRGQAVDTGTEAGLQLVSYHKHRNRKKKGHNAQ